MRTLLILLFALPLALPAQQLDAIFARRNEVCFQFPDPGAAALARIGRFISIDHGSRRDTVRAYANRAGFERFLAEAIPYTVLPHPGDRAAIPTRALADWLAKASPCQDTIDYYPSYELYEAMMQDFADNFPELCRLEEVGLLPSGRKLLAVVISDNVHTAEAEPQFLYTATMHGDETAGYPVTLRLISYLLCRYGADPFVTTLVDEVEIWVNPLANPDGTFTDDNATLSGATRFNSNGVDLNRNYPDPEDGPNPDGNAWQPETLAFLALADAQHFDLSANLHGGVEVANYPWDTWQRRHADDDWWQLVCRQYADTAQLYGPPGYFNFLDDGITNGYDWYTVAGGRQDFMTYFHRGREFTLEMSDTKLIPQSQIENFWQYNYRSLLHYIDQARYGLRGVVTDSITGEPLAARIEAAAHDLDSSHVYSRLPHGDYYRFLKAGSYAFTFSAPGYLPKTIDVTVEDFAATVLDVQLAPEGVSSTGTTAFGPLALEVIATAPGELTINWSRPPTQSLQLLLLDAAGRTLASHTVAAGTLSGWRWAVPGLGPGVYFVATRDGSRWITEKVFVN